ncbi:MAG: adenosylmethionine--8-amino-7-oxononanoate transaminase [Candidatus Glassbacteria bacterium]|nr:adenosylmethionine--8-amino-7-oxononanoate transaminase [Candidatus Glassbacteria bacterium]
MKTSSPGLAELDYRHVWHPFTPMLLWEEEGAPVIERGEGSWLIDTEGRRYLDGTSSLWVILHGHGHPHITAALKRQADRLCHSTMLGLTNEPASRLAAKLVEIAPDGLERVFYSDNGSTAMEVAIKMAYQYRRLSPDPAERQRTGFISFRNAYHGDTIGSVSTGGIDLFHGTFRDLLFPVESSEYPYHYRSGGGLDREQYRDKCLAGLEEVIGRNRERAGTVVIEPLVQGAGGMVTAEVGFLAGVRDLCDRYGMLLVADEVATGFGRTGRMFACGHESVRPDFLCLAKGITGGYLPLAATLTTGHIYERFLGTRENPVTFYHGHSYTGNPLAAAAALASLEVFEKENVLENLPSTIEFLARALKEQVEPLAAAGEVRRRGMMVGIELVADRESRAAFAPGLRFPKRVILEARRRGVIIRPLGDVIVLMPHLSFSEQELAMLVEVTAGSIEKVWREVNG